MIYESLSEYMDANPELTQVEFAEKLEISQPHLNQILQGNRRPSPELALRIEKVTGIPLRKLLFPEEEQQASKIADPA